MSKQMDIAALSLDIAMMLDESKDVLKENFRIGQLPILGPDERPDFESVFEALNGIIYCYEGELYERALRIKNEK